MIERDTILLLRECDAGAAMGVRALHDVLGRAGGALGELLRAHKEAHERIVRDIRSALDRFGDAGKAPNPLAACMARCKTGVMLALGGGDAAIASLMTDGGNMGVKSLSRYLNQYAAADEDAKAICKRLIAAEEALVKGLRDHL